jgi:hypothetical protein
MTPQKIKKIRGSLKRKAFCGELNIISKSLLPDAQEITVRSLINYESGYPSNHRDPPDWVRYVIGLYSKEQKS